MDAYEQRRQAWNDLEVTREELKDLSDCLKKEEFRKLLIEYAEEVSDPANRKLYQEEFTQLEKERGVDVTFVNPQPGYVIKTSVDGEKKCFLNISQNENVKKPSSQPSQDGEQRGLRWSIPYTLSPPRDDLDKKNVRCLVFDVVFHPDTLYLASRNPRFKEIVNNTALDGVEDSFKMKVDRRNLKFPKMNYKGISQPSVIRKPSEKPMEKKLDIEPEIYQKLMTQYDECREQSTKKFIEKPQRLHPKTTYYQDKKELQNQNDEYTIPKYTLIHQKDIDLEEFTNNRDAKMHSAIPKRLVIEIKLPLLRSASDATLDVFERSLILKSEKPAKYLLKLPLPYSVNSDNGNAKFDAKYKKLIITLPVIRQNISLKDTREDSGVDTDHGSPLRDNNDGSSEISESKSPKESNLKPLFVELSDKSEVQVEKCEDTALRTEDNVENSNTFMNPKIKYYIPTFTCNVYDSILAITIHVKNVDSESIRHKFLIENSGIHVLLTSIGAGFFPIDYSICLKISQESVDPNTLTVEPWDNNVVVTVALRNTDLSKYYFGINEEFMEEKNFSSAIFIKNKLKELREEPEEETNANVEVSRNGDEVIINIHSKDLGTDEEEDRKHSLEQNKSICESSGDELPSSNASSYKSKGILKSRRNKFTRSVSESSIDDGTGLASSVNISYDYVHEINSELESSSLKKTVRFNDVVSRQSYRTNSSILGQRKKNQRKLRNKKRAHDRRMSESENSETEDRDKYKTEIDLSSNEATPSADSVKSTLTLDKEAEKGKTECIEIESLQHNSKNTSVKRKYCKQKRNENLSEESKENDNGNDVQAEFKSDLIFDLDI